MTDTIGKLSPRYVWALAAAAVVLTAGVAVLTAGPGTNVSSAASFAVFLAHGFVAVALTKAKALLSLSAFLLASMASAATAHLVALQTIAEATGALGAASAGGALGAALGALVAMVTFAVSAAGGGSGVLPGLRAREQLRAA